MFRNVGFLRYWTMSNLPLFLLAGPMLAIMLSSSIWAVRGHDIPAGNDVPAGAAAPRDGGKGRPALQSVRPDDDLARRCLRGFGLTQLLLAVLALAVYHVQIITRISSGYVIWYWWLAVLVDRDLKPNVVGTKRSVPQLIIRWMIIYGLVQSCLFGSFLPPA